MAPKPKDNASATFSFDTVAAMLAAVQQENGRVLGKSDFDFMSRILENRTPSALEHQFRAVKQRAKEMISGNVSAASPKSKSTPKRKTVVKAKEDSPDVYSDEEEEPLSNKKVKKEDPYKDQDPGSGIFAHQRIR